MRSRATDPFDPSSSRARDDFNREGLGIELNFSLPAERVIRSLKPGVSELYIHVSLDHPEMRALTGKEPMRTGWQDRIEEYRIFTVDPELRRLLEIQGIKLVRWRDLRDLQRRERQRGGVTRP